MHRRSFLKGASLSAFTAIRGSAQTRELRIAYGGIGIECSTYSRLRTRMDEFTILRGAEATSNDRFQFLRRYPVNFLPTLVATAVPGGPVAQSAYLAIKASFCSV
jgi:microcystin degradation protein MlrC